MLCYLPLLIFLVKSFQSKQEIIYKRARVDIHASRQSPIEAKKIKDRKIMSLTVPFVASILTLFDPRNSDNISIF